MLAVLVAQGGPTVLVVLAEQVAEAAEIHLELPILVVVVRLVVLES